MITTTLTTSEMVNDIVSNPCDVFVATTSGMDVVRKSDYVNTAYVTISGGVSSVYHKPNQCSGLLYMGTNNGVKSLATTPTLSGDLGLIVSDKYNATHQLLSDVVDLIDGNEGGDVAIASFSGIDLYLYSGGHYSSVISGGLSSLFLTETGDLYYSPVVGGGLYVKYGPVSDDWSTPDYSVTTGTYPLPGNEINDIEIGSVSGTNHVFVATVSGLFIYEESRSDIQSSLSGAVIYTNYP